MGPVSFERRREPVDTSTNEGGPVKLLFRLVFLGSAALLTGLPTVAADRADVLKAAREVAEKARYATFITIGQDGQPQARIVDPLGPDEDFNLWVGTNPLTRKVAEIAKDPRVTVSFFDLAGPAYVTLVGTARLVVDPAEKAKHWKSAWAPFYKNEHRGADFALIAVVPRRLEIVSQGHGLLNEPVTWRPVSIGFPAKAPTP
jgi:general stress protein 26